MIIEKFASTTQPRRTSKGLKILSCKSRIRLRLIESMGEILSDWHCNTWAACYVWLGSGFRIDRELTARFLLRSLLFLVTYLDNQFLTGISRGWLALIDLLAWSLWATGLATCLWWEGLIHLNSGRRIWWREISRWRVLASGWPVGVVPKVYYYVFFVVNCWRRSFCASEE